MAYVLKGLLALVNTLPYVFFMTSRTRPRLNAEDWLMAGFRALASSGSTALKAEALARDLGTTKGSFYWHFADLPDYLTRLIRLWEEKAFDGVIAQLDPGALPRVRLEQLCLLAVGFRDPSYGGAALEPAVRAWALASQEVAKAVARMDSRRIAYLGSLCREAGVAAPDAPEALYALVVGLETLGVKDPHKTMRLLLSSL
jgi:AcrR family transcriptional regulator